MLVWFLVYDQSISVIVFRFQDFLLFLFCQNSRSERVNEELRNKKNMNKVINGQRHVLIQKGAPKGDLGRAHENGFKEMTGGVADQIKGKRSRRTASLSTFNLSVRVSHRYTKESRNPSLSESEEADE